MSKFAAFFVMEFKRFFRRRNLVIFLVLLALCLFLVNTGVDKYKTSIERAEKFKEIEVKNFKNFRNYAIYVNKGISILFNYASSSVFFSNMGVPSDLIGKIDTFGHLGVFDNYKDHSLFAGNSSGPWSVAGVLLFFGSLLALFYGYETFRDRGYLKFLSGFLSPARAFFSMALARFILLSIALAILFAAMLLVAILRKVIFSGHDLAILSGFFLVLLLVLLVLFILGITVGVVSRKQGGVIAVIALWFALVFLVPGFVNTLIENNAVDSTDDYQKVIDKFKVIKDFENRFIEKAKKLKMGNLEAQKRFMDEFWNIEYNKIESIENQLRGRIESNIGKYRIISVFIPTIFYNLTSGEVSSTGYGSFLDFYDYLQEQKRNFVRYYIDRLNAKLPREMVNFIQNDENLFMAKSKLPGNFMAGVAVNFIYILSLLVISFNRFRCNLYLPEVKQKVKEENQPIILSKGDQLALVLYRGHNGFNDHLYNILSGRQDEFNKELKIEVNSNDLRDHASKQDFLYVCSPREFPEDIKGGAFISLIAKLLKVSSAEKQAMMAAIDPRNRYQPFNKLDDLSRGRVLLAVLPYFKHQIYLLDNVSQDMPVEFIFQLNDIMKQWAQAEGAVIYLTTDSEVNIEHTHDMLTKDVEELHGWFSMVGKLKDIAQKS